jgi:hypothetical protein
MFSAFSHAMLVGRNTERAVWNSKEQTMWKQGPPSVIWLEDLSFDAFGISLEDLSSIAFGARVVKCHGTRYVLNAALIFRLGQSKIVTSSLQRRRRRRSRRRRRRRRGGGEEEEEEEE